MKADSSVVLGTSVLSGHPTLVPELSHHPSEKPLPALRLGSGHGPRRLDLAVLDIACPGLCSGSPWVCAFL